ncbi:DUF1876 domain-containing protein [Mycobacterium branderi]|uniref:DUF1876 domain-containing protein n=1 Tax=Mycobacterium branderi TaxID=43348 RepID=A0A7I7W7E0_9MYCO|nr:DUF1876 domain-containing protein [Mycobacterium branderi]MCV7231172.1 DUF1876 domain-containing protein [Mycobacterium branderi]ORA35740.1 hypothetical protein BST20_16865 [Mycobacterium branderi]BBZ12792.1 hypothetical protein MBRA_29870 [Mycobacterium branderi]
MNKDDSQRQKKWTFEVAVDQHPNDTRAKATVHWRGRELTGTGLAHRNPADRDVPAIGDQLAVARALTDLADQLFAATASDINDITHEPVVIFH